MTPEDLANIQRQKEENEVFRTIISTLKQRSRASTTLQQTLASPEFQGEDYAAERKIIGVVNDIGITQGLSLGVATFFILRGGPRYVLQLLRRSGASNPSQRGGYQLDRPSSDPPRLSTALRKSFKLVVDVWLSAAVGSLFTIQQTDARKITKEVSLLPLVEGRSVICDELCTTLQEEVAKHSPQFWIGAQRNIYLTSIHVLAENCAKRQAYERQLREEQGLPPGTPIAIPLGGVPTNYDVAAGGGGGNSESQFDENYFGDGYSSNESDSLFGDESADQWSDSLVTDREDQRK